MRGSHNKENKHLWDLGGRSTHRVGCAPLGWEASMAGAHMPLQPAVFMTLVLRGHH